MKIILKEDVGGLGRAGEVVTVKDGYARNYLIPQQLAIPASNRNMRQLDHAKRLVETHRKKIAATSADLKQRLEGLQVEISKLVGEEAKLYGSVTALEIAESLASQGIEIDKRTLVLDEPIRALGEYQIRVKLKQSDPAVIKVRVIASKG